MKDERHLDRFDRVFSEFFKGVERVAGTEAVDEVELPEEWLKKLAEKHLTEEDKKKGKVTVTRFKGLGEMNPLQLRESSIAPDTRRLAQLTIEPGDKTFEIMNMLLSKKQAADRKTWLQQKGDLAVV